MLKLNVAYKNPEQANLTEFVDFCEEDFELNKQKDGEKNLVGQMKRNNKQEFRSNIKLKDYV